MAVLEPSDDVPDFELPDQRGGLTLLSDSYGEHTVVYFHPCADTPDCTVGICGFRDSWDEPEDCDTTVLDISNNPVPNLNSSTEKYGLSFMFLSDENGSISATHNSYDEKNIFDRILNGVFCNLHLVGPDGTAEWVYGGISPDDHVDGILTDLDS